MSGAQVAPTDGGAAPPPADDREKQDRARRLGWRPREEYQGAPEKWVPHDEFLDRGASDTRILMHNLETLDRRFQRLERENSNVTSQLAQANARVAETGQTVQQLSTMLRTADQRAYDRAKRELEAERSKAVETGDTATFQRLDTELDELRKTAPAAPQAGQPGAMPTTPAPAFTGEPPPGMLHQDPLIDAFYRRNPWYRHPRNASAAVDGELSTEADMIHIGLRNAMPQLTLEQNLAEVERRLRLQFPHKFGLGAAPAVQQQSAQPSEAGGGDNVRRAMPASVMPSGEPGGHRAPTNRFNFDSMPKDSKDAYKKYAEQLKGHGEPLTREEWAHSYYLQDQAYMDYLEARGGA